MKEMLAAGGSPASSEALTGPSVLCTSFSLAENRLGLLLVNLRRGEPVNVRIPIDPVSAGLKSGIYQVHVRTMDGSRRIGTFRNRKEMEIELPPREMVLVRLQENERRGDGESGAASPRWNLRFPASHPAPIKCPVLITVNKAAPPETRHDRSR